MFVKCYNSIIFNFKQEYLYYLFSISLKSNRYGKSRYAWFESRQKKSLKYLLTYSVKKTLVLQKILNKWRNVTTALNLSSSTNGKIFVKSGVKVTTDKNDTLQIQSSIQKFKWKIQICNFRQQEGKIKLTTGGISPFLQQQQPRTRSFQSY